MSCLRSYFPATRHFLASGLIGLALHAQGAERLLEKIPDPPERPTRAEIDDMEARAEAGDWAIKQQFAAAYLYEYLTRQYWDRGCKHLKNGHLCRALAERSEFGRRALYEIVDGEGDGPVSRTVLARFQVDLAYRRVLDARPDFSPEHPACKEAARYFERAIENEREAANGKSCTAEHFAQMYSHGQCVKADPENYRKYIALSVGCPEF